MQGERKPVTILFTDIVGSTTHAEKLDPEEWKEIVNAAHRIVSDAVYRYQGTIAQLLGDGVLAFFGAPISHEDDPLRAVKAGLEIQKKIGERFSTEPATLRSQQWFGMTNLQMRVGIHSGLVVVDNVGSDAHMEYLAVGDAVNLAARLQSHAEPDTVLISEVTYRAIAHAVECEDRGIIQVKGKVEPIHVYRPLREVVGTRNVRASSALTSALVGRATELEQLIRASDLLETGVGRVMILVGEPGVGKSRLIAEWREQTRHSWAESSALAYGQGLAYRLVSDLARSFIGVHPATNEVETARALHELTRELFGDVAGETFAYLANLLALPLDAEAQRFINALDPRGLQTQYRAALEKILLAKADHAPSVLLCEDMHWADASSVDMLIKLLPLVKRAPILFAFTTRPEHESAGWKIVSSARDTLGASVNVLELAALNADASQQFASNLLGLDTLPPPIQNLVLGKSEGNPLFIQEIIHALMESGALTRAENGWSLTVNASTLDIPDNLKRLILARVDRLADEPKRALRVASVIGREFFVSVLERVLSQVGHATARTQLVSELDALEFSNLIRLVATRPEIQYLFSHALVQEATYEAMLKADRRALHHAVGEALEAAFPERREELSATLAFHFQNAGERSKAIGYFLTAAERSRAQYANGEALALYQAALRELEAEGSHTFVARLAEVYEAIGVVYQVMGKHVEAREMYAQARERVSEALTRARLHRLTGAAWMMIRNSEVALQEFDAAERELENAQDSQARTMEWMEIQLERGWALYWLDRGEDMDAWNAKLFPMLQAQGTPKQRSKFYRNRALAAMRRYRYVMSDEVLAEGYLAYENALASNAPSEITFSHFVYSFCFLWRGDLAMAETHLLETLALCEKIGDALNRLLCLNYLAILCRRKKNFEQTLTYANKTLEMATALQIPLYGDLAKLQ